MKKSFVILLVYLTGGSSCSQVQPPIFIMLATERKVCRSGVVGAEKGMGGVVFQSVAELGV